jgi:chromate transporter
MAAGARSVDAGAGHAFGSPLEVFVVALRLGLTSFGGPVAHLGYFREEYVVRRRWLDDQSYADLVALCQFLPGPASSQVGIGVGLIRAGLWGGIAAWIGFTLPSAIIMVAFAMGVQHFGVTEAGWLRGLNIVAVAVVALAVWGMARSLCPDRPRATIAIVAAVLTLLWQVALIQVLIILLGALVGWRILSLPRSMTGSALVVPVSRRMALTSLAMLAALLVALPILARLTGSAGVALFDSFYRVGALVFGGGHVVLPLLAAEVVPPGWVTNDQFVAGYGAAQAVPGPLFTFAAYLGAVRVEPPNGVAGATLALVAVFLPSFFLVIGALPFWEGLRAQATFQSALGGINAAVVGLLIAALYQPVWTSAISTPGDFSLALVAFGLLAFWRVPPWFVVLLGATVGGLAALLPRW